MLGKAMQVLSTFRTPTSLGGCPGAGCAVLRITTNRFRPCTLVARQTTVLRRTVERLCEESGAVLIGPVSRLLHKFIFVFNFIFIQAVARRWLLVYAERFVVCAESVGSGVCRVNAGM